MKKRYHVHVCYAGSDLVAERSILMQKFADKCFFTWNLPESNASAANYSRKQIDDADYVIFLIGSVYGSLAASGVSYLHLEYIYTTTKHKPMIVMMHDEPPTPHMLAKKSIKQDYSARKQKDFRDHIARENHNLNYFNSNIDFINKVNTAFTQLTQRHERKGWLPADSTQTKALSNTGEHRAVDGTDELLLMGIAKVSLNDMVVIRYKVQAFQGGNFKELSLTKDLAWGDVLSIVADSLRMPTPEDVLVKQLYDYLDANALKDVNEIMPHAHATARSQMSQRDIQNIKLQFAANEWIQTTDSSVTGRKMLMLTPHGARQVTQWRGVMSRMRSIGI